MSEAKEINFAAALDQYTKKDKENVVSDKPVPSLDENAKGKKRNVPETVQKVKEKKDLDLKGAIREQEEKAPVPPVADEGRWTNYEALEVSENPLLPILEKLNSTLDHLEKRLEQQEKQYALLEHTIRNLKIEVPPPIVEVTLPEKKVIREFHRDEKGLLTHTVDRIEKDDD